jgi:hypothetical protein
VSTSDAVYAAAFVAEFDRRKAEGITPNFQVGYPYREQNGEEAWLEWCAALAHEHAETVVKAYTRASNKSWAKKAVWWNR